MSSTTLDGVDGVEASYKKKSAVVTYEPDEVTPDDIIAAIVDLGYAAELKDSQDSGAEGTRK